MSAALVLVAHSKASLPMRTHGTVAYPTLSIEEFRTDVDRDEYLRRADAVLAELRKDAVPPLWIIDEASDIPPEAMQYAADRIAHPQPEERKFKLGERVTKTKGSSWTGLVVGFYSTNLTKIGYAVESENEPGSVQIYPENALQLESLLTW